MHKQFLQVFAHRFIIFDYENSFHTPRRVHSPLLAILTSAEARWLFNRPCPGLHSLMGNKWLFIGVCGLLGGCATGSDWLERIGRGTGTGLTQDQIVAGLKEALDKGTEHAVNSLGRDGGFLQNAQVRIPLPEKLRTVERTLQALGQDQLVNEFETTINRAAERAVPEAAEVLASSIRQMRLADAEQILRGHDTAATDYFRRTGETNLHQRFLPIVKQATAAVGVTAAYKRMMERLSFGGIGEAILGREAVDLDSYITGKALDALFLKIAEQEKLIRENPAARTTELLRKVFGAILGNSKTS
jgi:hypothetical protein